MHKKSLQRCPKLSNIYDVHLLYMNACSASPFFSIIGWGKTSFNSSFSEFLQEAKMPVVDYKTCAAGNINLPQKVDDKTMVCAGYGGNSVVSGCHGDSGGPFVCQESGRWVLRGAVSWGDHRCRSRSTFSVFARISTFVDWIRTTMRKPDCVPGKILVNWRNPSVQKVPPLLRKAKPLAYHCHLERNGHTDNNDEPVKIQYCHFFRLNNYSESVTS